MRQTKQDVGAMDCQVVHQLDERAHPGGERHITTLGLDRGLVLAIPWHTGIRLANVAIIPPGKLSTRSRSARH
jgi:hypothetical protein